MGGKGGGGVSGYWYELGMELGACIGPVDMVTALRAADKWIWAGQVADGRIRIHAPEAFGGEQREGGVSGRIDIRGGGAAQGFNDYLEARRPFRTGAARGVLSFVLRRARISANNPYIKTWHGTVRRVLTRHDGAAQWYPETAVIPDDPILRHAAIWIALDMSFANEHGQNDARLASLRDGLAGFLTALKTRMDPDWPSVIRLRTFGFTVVSEIEAEIAAPADLDPLIAWAQAIDVTGLIGENLSRATEGIGTFFNGGPGVDHPWAEAGAWGEEGGFEHEPGDGPGADGRRRLCILIASAAGEPASELAAAQAHLDEAGEVEVHGIMPGAVAGGSVADLVTVPGGAVAPALGSASELQAALSAILAAADMNAVHILRDVLSDPALGAHAEAEFGPSWEAAADTAYAERFGLSFQHSFTGPIEEFLEEVKRHLGAVTYEDPETGLLEIRLLRADYDLAATPILDEACVIDWGRLARRQRAETVTGTAVIYRDRLLGDVESVPADDPAARIARGEDNPETLRYPGIRRADLAARVAARDLRLLSAELLSGEIGVTFAAGHGLRPGDVVRLRSPRRGLEDVPCRVGEPQHPGAEGGPILLPLTEELHDLPAASHIAGSDRLASSLISAPRPAALRMVEEATWRGLVFGLGGDAEADARLAADPGFGALAVAAGRPVADAIDAAIRVDAGAGAEETGTLAFVPAATLLEDLGEAADQTLARITASADLGRVATGSLAWLGGEWVRVDALAPVTTVEHGAHALLTLGRGCLDTVPVAHLAGEAVLFTGDAPGSDRVAYTEGDALDVKILPRTARGTLRPGAAPEDAVEMDGRALRPLPAGRVMINGEWTVPEGASLVAGVNLDWAHRSRLLQTGAYVEDFTDLSVGPEEGVTYRLEAQWLDANGAQIEEAHAEDLGAVAAVTVTLADLGDPHPSAAAARLAIRAMRDGISDWTRRSFVLTIPTGDAGAYLFSMLSRSTAYTLSGFGRVAFNVLDYGPVPAIPEHATAAAAGAYVVLAHTMVDGRAARVSPYIAQVNADDTVSKIYMPVSGRAASNAWIGRCSPMARTIQAEAGDMVRSVIDAYGSGSLSVRAGAALALIRPGRLVAAAASAAAQALASGIQPLTLDTLEGGAPSALTGDAITAQITGLHLVIASASAPASPAVPLPTRFYLTATRAGAVLLRHGFYFGAYGATTLPSGGVAMAALADLSAGDAISLSLETAGGVTLDAAGAALALWEVDPADIVASWGFASDVTVPTAASGRYDAAPSVLLNGSGPAVATPGKIAAPEAGRYLLVVQLGLEMAASAAASPAVMSLVVNNETSGADYFLPSAEQADVAGAPFGYCMALPVELAAGDVLKLQVYVQSGQPQHKVRAGTESRFSLLKLAEA